jgi:Predicted transcriptional regulator
MKRIIAISILLPLCLILKAQQASVGKTVGNVRILSTANKLTGIPELGQKVLILFYTDPDVKDVNDPLSDAVKAKKFSHDKLAGIGIANCKETWIPNSAILMKSRQKEKQFPGSVVLLDENQTIKTAWSLADCNDRGVVIVVGKDMRIKYISYVKSQDESKSIIGHVIRTIQEEINR